MVKPIMKSLLLIVYIVFLPLLLLAQSNKPNIIFILTDDQRWDALGVMGNTILKTPNLDNLANNGILFRNAYVTTSICCVSRASILTGAYQNKHKINDFVTDMSKDVLTATYPYLLKQNGYQVGFIGKYGIGTAPPKEQYDFWVNTEDGGKMQPDYIQTFENGRRLHDTDTLSNAIQTFLDGYSGKQPFCLSVSFKAPHEQDGNPPKYFVQPGYEQLYKDVTIPYPVTAKETYWNQFPDFFRTDSNFARVRWKGLLGTPELYQENVKNYYRLITGVDDAIGRMVHKLKEKGLDKNTVIIFMGDNGMMLGEKNIEGKWFGYEESIRVPLIIYDPRTPDKIKNLKAQQVALNIDIAPTILSLAEIKVPDFMQGVNLIDVVQGNIPEREHFFYQHYFLGSPRIPMVEGVVTKDFKYMNFIEHNYEELFDTRSDPHEIDNLSQNTSYSNQLRKMRKLFREMKKRYGVDINHNAPNNERF
ncbi:sulfatase family protein [Lacibacter sediminis]|uniref:Sulfatase n=1 Tax=Lacibacter sediminis TaxID=2760713 RepID=A0A7G5XDA6_9BACT|nr:sulfatase [Lacibacter sediminis]QNA43459.1 sulfatase [Lacibacter sediminis]